MFCPLFNACYSRQPLITIFRHNFKIALSPMCDCGSETETTDHFFLRCPFFTINRQKLLNDLLKIDPSLNDELLLYGYIIWL